MWKENGDLLAYMAAASVGVVVAGVIGAWLVLYQLAAQDSNISREEYVRLSQEIVMESIAAGPSCTADDNS